MASLIPSDKSFLGDIDIIDSLDSKEARRQFEGLLHSKPTLREALTAAGVPSQNIDSILKDSREFSEKAKKDPKIAALGLTDDEAGAISCYTLEVKGTKSPYKIINEGLAGSRSRGTLSATRKLIYLLLSGLRKLPRFKPSKEPKMFYRGIKAKVPRTQEEATTTDENGEEITHQYYKAGRTVTWWAFTSTTTSLKATKKFLKGAESSTLFNICGEDLWGYDIKPFSPFLKEEEVLLEPEAKIKVESTVKLGNSLVIYASFQNFERLVLEDIIPAVEAVPELKRLPEDPPSGQPPQKVQGLDPITVHTEDKWECAWKKCPDNVGMKRKYSVNRKNPRIVTNIGGDYCTIIGNAPLPTDKVTSWSIKILNLGNVEGNSIDIGVAPSDIDQNNDDNYMKCGWYFIYPISALCSGPPHKFDYKEYGPEKEGDCFHNGGTVGVVMDTEKGELSFVLNGVNLGVAYKGIPLDKPLVPCVLLNQPGDSVRLYLAEVKENAMDSSVSVPSNITPKSITWNTITLTWDVVDGASFYQIEVDKRKQWGGSTTNIFTKRGLLPETGHDFRVRAVRGDSVSGWSDVVKGRTQKKSFETSGWEECPDYVGLYREYSVDKENPRIATMIGVGDYDFCTIIGNTPLPLNKVTSWNIKILKSKGNNGCGIWIGVASFYINQNEGGKCGWYFDCYRSTLCSGPPHNYRNNEYGPRKGEGQYVHTGDSVCVVMDTAKGELSFVFNGVNLWVAYEGIPLDKPLVPCVLLRYTGDSVELLI